MKTTPRILVFDSGVGGLSIAEAIRQQHPSCSLVYASDNAAFPYGTKSEETLVARVDSVLHALQTKTNANIIVVACNTASTLALPIIRQRFDIPIVGVVPAIKPAAQLSATKVIGLLATPGTISRPYTQTLIDEHAQHCSIIKLGSSELVTLAEEVLRNPELTEKNEYLQRLHQIVEPFKHEHRMDTIVLACTHFPLLRESLAAVLPHIQYWVDSGEAIARRVGYWLNELGFVNDLASNTQPKHHSVFTAQQETVEMLIPALTTRGLQDVIYLDCPYIPRQELT